MPTGKLQFAHKLMPTFVYPPSGKARVVVSSDEPVDVYISTPQQAPLINSITDAARFAPQVLIYNQQKNLDQIVELPAAWRALGWTLVIGHSGFSKEPAAIHYDVYLL